MITQQNRVWLGSMFLIVSALIAREAWAVTGTAGRFSGISRVVPQCSITTAFATIPGMTQTLTFQASWSGVAGTFDMAFVRLTIDGVVQPTNVAVPIFAGANRPITHGFTWISGPVTPGSHTARIQWRTDEGSTLCVEDRTLVVLHR